MNKKRVNIKDVMDIEARRKEINSLDFDEIEWVDENNNSIEIDEKFIEEWKFMGMNNMDFITSEFYKGND